MLDMPPEKLERLLRIELPLSVTLAEKKITLGEVLNFGIGMLIEFEKHVEEPLELRIQERTIACGEAVKVAGHFGIELTDVGAMRETIRSLGVT